MEVTAQAVGDVLVAVLLNEIERITGADYNLVIDEDKLTELLAQRNGGWNELCDLDIQDDIITIKLNKKHEFFKGR